MVGSVMNLYKPDEFVRLDYSERQLIVVTSNEVALSARKAEEEAKAKAKEEGISQDKDVDWVKISTLLMKTVYIGIVPAVVEITRVAVNAWNKARLSGIDIKLVGKSEVSNIVFPIGHPRNDVLYIGHPAKENVYYTLSDFHRLTFEHKFCEAIDMLMALGAVDINVEHVSGWAKEFSAKIDVPLSSVGDSVKGQVGASRNSSSEILFVASLPGIEPAQLPVDLSWYQHEPTWQTIANGRLKYGMKDFSLSVRYQDDFGINAGLKVAIAKSGFDLGGSFEDHRSTVWKITGKFK